MNIIILSGGSGQRLWPLSNDIRSKQFIRIFENENGECESMIQRVYRQIKSVDPNAKITIATSRKQASAIKNHLGEKVSICTEPARRDTFPAIALASVFLKDKENVGLDEPVIVCPVDPFVDDDYFEAIKKLSELVEKGDFKLNLMGVEPTEPSEKFGYIIPETKQSRSKVAEFKEKPDRETAKKYIADGALWNCGIFGFKLGYLLDIAHKLIDFTDYNDLYNKYETLTKISFDYAVVEKENAIQVMRFNGRWKDVGSWLTFTDELKTDIVGNCVTDDKCENTNILNELNIPILVMGMKDTIVAATSNGILVSSKKESDNIKPYVDKMDNTVMFEEKSWGNYTVLDIQNENMTVKITLREGQQLSYHSHQFRDEVWTVVSGKGHAVVDGIKKELAPGDTIVIKSGTKHKAIAETELCIIENQIGKDLSVSDKFKYDEI